MTTTAKQNAPTAQVKFSLMVGGRGHHSYVKFGRGVMHEIYWDFANSGRVRLKFGHTKLGREIKTGKLMFSRGNNPLHTHMAATCSKAAGFNLNTSHFVFSNQAYM